MYVPHCAMCNHSVILIQHHNNILPCRRTSYCTVYCMTYEHITLTLYMSPKIYHPVEAQSLIIIIFIHWVYMYNKNTCNNIIT